MDAEPGCPILSRGRAASAEVPCGSCMCVGGDAPPEKVEHVEIAMRRRHAGATEFEHLRPHRLERSKIELALAIVSAIARRACAGLHAIRSHHIAGRRFADD